MWPLVAATSQGSKPASLAPELTLPTWSAPLPPYTVLRAVSAIILPCRSNSPFMEVKNVNQNLLLGEHMHCCKFVFKREKIFGNRIS